MQIGSMMPGGERAPIAKAKDTFWQGPPSHRNRGWMRYFGMGARVPRPYPEVTSAKLSLCLSSTNQVVKAGLEPDFAVRAGAVARMSHSASSTRYGDMRESPDIARHSASQTRVNAQARSSGLHPCGLTVRADHPTFSMHRSHPRRASQRRCRHPGQPAPPLPSVRRTRSRKQCVCRW